MELKKSHRITLLRPKVLGKALAYTWALVALSVTLAAMVSGGQPGKLVQIFELIYPGYSLSGTGVLLGLVWAYIYGWLTGYLIGRIYSYLLIKKVKEKETPVVDVDPGRIVNLIQAGDGGRPYTIVIVANPAIYSTKKDNQGTILEEKIVADPVIKNEDLFYKIVLRIMRSFAKNELLSLPEIESRIRLITIFDKTRPAKKVSEPDVNEIRYENALCQNLENISRVIAPRFIEKAPEYILNYVRKTKNDDSRLGGEKAFKNIDVDVVFLVSASEELTRSAARFTEDNNLDGGKEFDFDFQVTGEGNSGTTYQHAYFAQYPGTIALSAWDDRLKVPVHEFAHAMSAENNGIIYDEYVDQYHVDETNIQKDDAAGLKLVLNRKHRGTSADPIPNVFGKYRFDGHEVTYYSDRYRSDKPADWTSFTPEKEDIYSSCIMDHTYLKYLFDKLVFDFMYDRLMTKMDRP